MIEKFSDYESVGFLNLNDFHPKPVAHGALGHKNRNFVLCSAHSAAL